MFPDVFGFDGVHSTEGNLVAMEDVSTCVVHTNGSAAVLLMGLLLAFCMRQSSFDSGLVLVERHSVAWLKILVLQGHKLVVVDSGGFAWSNCHSR